MHKRGKKLCDEHSVLPTRLCSTSCAVALRSPVRDEWNAMSIPYFTFSNGIAYIDQSDTAGSNRELFAKLRGG